jgi:hypothetical protein
LKLLVDGLAPSAVRTLAFETSPAPGPNAMRRPASGARPLRPFLENLVSFFSSSSSFRLYHVSMIM